MMRSLWSGVSGLKNHQIRMDVIGNNVSNVNTHGYKAERVNFMDMLSQTISDASEPQDNVGGTNPKQVGLGMTVATIDKIMTQGSLQTTGKNTDLAIAGDGFFIIKDGNKAFYTRAGFFNLDRDGYYVHPATGLRVQGWNSRIDEDGKRYVNSTGNLENVRLPIYSKQEARATQVIKYGSNLDQSVEVILPDATEQQLQSYVRGPLAERRGHVSTINVYDPQGNKREFRLEFYKTENNLWRARAFLEDTTNLTVNVVSVGGEDIAVGANNAFELGFRTDGRLASISDGIDTNNVGNLRVQVNFNIPGNPDLQSFDLDLGEAGTISGITQFASEFTARAREQDGHPMGYLESFAIDNSGTVIGTFSNGVKEPLAKVATAVFANPGGLKKEGETKYSYTLNSGDPNIGDAGVGGRGQINAGLLEMSNVDLAEEFTNLIVTQRGFQANSRSITTSDQMLQELLTLKR